MSARRLARDAELLQAIQQRRASEAEARHRAMRPSNHLLGVLTVISLVPKTAAIYVVRRHVSATGSGQPTSVQDRRLTARTASAD